MNPLRKLIGSDKPTREQIDAFLESRTFPIVEGRQITFVFHGRADQVNLRHFILGLASSQPFERWTETDLWHLTLEIPECSRIEYKIERVTAEGREWIMDPLNPNVAQDPYGANSVCLGAGYETPPWTRVDPEARPGTLDQLMVPTPALGGERPVRIYLPARFRRTRRYPLLVVHDGDDYLRYAELKIVLDNLIHRLEIPPVIVALTSSARRLVEYGADDRHARFLTEDLVPQLERKLPLIGQPKARCLVGASFGAVAALHAAWRSSGFYGRLLLQSGSFAFSEIGDHEKGPLFDTVVEFVNAFREKPGRPVRKIFLSCGIFEPMIYENRSILPLLQSTGMNVRFVEARDGHNWDNWRDRLREGLSWLFPGPLWMVYE